MGVHLRPAFRSALNPEATVLFTVLADDRDGRLVEALEAFARWLMEGDSGTRQQSERRGPKYVSRPIPVPGGRLLMVDLGDTLPPVLRGLPEHLAERLTAAGIVDATVDVPPLMADRHDTIAAFAPAARAFLAPRVGRPHRDWDAPPLDLLDATLAWLRDQADPATAPLGLVVSAEVPLAWPHVAQAGAAVLRSGPTAFTTLATDFTTAAAAAAVTSGLFDATPRATLTAAGPQWTVEVVAERMRGQREMIRGYPHPLGWAAVTADPDAARMAFWDWEDRWRDRPAQARPRRFYEQVSDVLVPDAMWYQVLSPGHLERLGGPPRGAVPLRDGTYELTIGEPTQWLPGHPDRAALLARGREALAGCLSTDDTAGPLIAARMRGWLANR